MAYVPVENRLGVQPIPVTNAVISGFQSGQSQFYGQAHPLGTIIRGSDSGLGTEGEFIYLLGVVSTVAGVLVRWGATTFQTTILPSTANLDVPVAVAMSANVAGQFGWYQIS